MHHYGQSVARKDWLGIFKVKFKRGNMIVHIMSIELLLFLQPDAIGWYAIIFWSVLCKDWIAVFRVKVTVKVQIFVYLILSVPLVLKPVYVHRLLFHRLKAGLTAIVYGMSVSVEFRMS